MLATGELLGWCRGAAPLHGTVAVCSEPRERRPRTGPTSPPWVRSGHPHQRASAGAAVQDPRLARSRFGTTSRTVPSVARKVITSRYDESPSGADVLDEPVVVRATCTTVVRRRTAAGRAAEAGRPPAPTVGERQPDRSRRGARRRGSGAPTGRGRLTIRGTARRAGRPARPADPFPPTHRRSPCPSRAC